jgi:hypothetical protein
MKEKTQEEMIATMAELLTKMEDDIVKIRNCLTISSSLLEREIDDGK